MQRKMVFSMIRRLPWKKAATKATTTAIATATCATPGVLFLVALKQCFKELGQSFRELGQSFKELGQSFRELGQSWELFEQRLKFAGALVLTGTACVVVTGAMAWELISWYDYESQNDNAFTLYWSDPFMIYWSDVTRFLRGLPCIWTRKADWGNLPRELWGDIGKRMVSRLDIASFRLVCKELHSSLPSPTGRFPLSLPPPPGCHPKYQDMPYTISELTIYRDRLGWPLKQVDQGGIFHPATKSFRNNKISGSLNRKFHKHSLFAKAYYPCMALNSPFWLRDSNGFPKKWVLVSSSNADGVNPNYARMCDLSVVAHLGGNMKGRLALLRLGGSPENWAWDTDFCTQVFVNIATYKGQLCTLDHGGRVYLMDYNSLTLNRICVPSSVPPRLERKKLFEVCGDLYLVDFKWKSKGDVEAYKLSLRLQKWIKVKHFCSARFSHVAPFLL